MPYIRGSAYHPAIAPPAPTKKLPPFAHHGPDQRVPSGRAHCRGRQHAHLPLPPVHHQLPLRAVPRHCRLLRDLPGSHTLFLVSVTFTNTVTCAVTGPVARFARQIAGQGYICAAPSSFHEFEGPEPLAYDVEGTDKGNAYKVEKARSIPP